MRKNTLSSLEKEKQGIGIRIKRGVLGEEEKNEGVERGGKRGKRTHDQKRFECLRPWRCNRGGKRKRRAKD